MAEPTLAQIFGANATQDANTITISKADLAANAGLNPSANNTGESLLVAVVKQAALTLNDANQENNPEQSISISLSENPSNIPRNEALFFRNTYTVELDSIIDPSLLVIDPNKY